MKKTNLNRVLINFFKTCLNFEVNAALVNDLVKR